MQNLELNLTELLMNLSWDPKNEGLPKIDGMVTFVKSVRDSKNVENLENLIQIFIFSRWIGMKLGFMD